MGRLAYALPGFQTTPEFDEKKVDFQSTNSQPLGLKPSFVQFDGCSNMMRTAGTGRYYKAIKLETALNITSEVS